MKSNIIRYDCMYFTNLDTVKCRAFELTRTAFVNKMSEMISKNVLGYGVSYDEESDSYLVTYQDFTYKTKYGKRDLKSDCEDEGLITQLKRLAKLTMRQKEINKEASLKEKNQKSLEESLMRKVNNGITGSNNEKRMKIKMLENEYKNNNNIFEEIFNTFKVMNYGDMWEYTFAIYGVLFGLCFVGAIVWAACTGAMTALYLFIPCIIFMIDTMVTIESSIDEFGYRGITMSLLSILTLPLNIVFNIVRKIVKIIKHNKEISSIKKEITDFNKKVKFVSKLKVNINEIEKFLDNTGMDYLKNAPTDLRETTELITELKDKIRLIEDKSLKRKYSIELYEIIKYYVDASINIKGENVIPKITSNQVTDLSRRVDEELKKEKEKKESQDIYDNYVDSINKQKSIGIR